MVHDCLWRICMLYAGWCTLYVSYISMGVNVCVGCVLFCVTINIVVPREIVKYYVLYDDSTYIQGIHRAYI